MDTSLEPKLETLQTAPLDSLIVEDNPDLSSLLVRCLEQDFEDEISGIEVSATLEEINHRLDLFSRGEVKLPSFVVADLSLPGGETPVEDLAAFLRSTSKRVAMVLVSGSGVDRMEELRDQLESDLLRIWILPKPFRVDAFRGVIRRVSSYLLGVKGSGSEVSSSFIPPVEEQEPQFTRKLSEFDDLRGLVSALPYHLGRIQLYEGIFGDLAELVAAELSALKEALDVSYDAFYSRWIESFPTNEKSSRRSSLLSILKLIPGAEFVLDVCLHDVNSILTPYFATGQSLVGEEWESLKLQLKDYVDRSLRPFSRYSMSGNPESFWSIQNVNEALDQLDNGMVAVDSDVDDDAHVYFPAGSLPSVIRTFYSNFKKVQRLTKKEAGRLSIHARQMDGRVRFYMVDNLKPFEDAVFPKIFDDKLPSEQGQGMGTGLRRTSVMMRLDNVRGSITSFHKRDGVWIEKSPNNSPRFLDMDEFAHLEPYLEENSTKVFVLDLPIVPALPEVTAIERL
jgi:hypothetical protein